MRKKNPQKSYYKHPDTFFIQFKDDASYSSVPDSADLTQNKDTLFEELDSAINEKEIIDAIYRLKRDKSHGIDLLIDEYFIYFKEDAIPMIYKLFSKIFLSGIFP